ncbi:hypothetical protein C8N24_0669 [Solirubrobacter pauli]|uniref:Lactonase family protein with 7-bladed beta-propeller n=1 Tax=Solirubrobacter pauli TaxID=166793 RepID=A0A660LCT0_9ACTN|nr:hypothetical protein [Solirubrobacter pauli]RKQ90854.1 hypothetical protein C8N24_0669 [Solirubrobacter pauli]
MITDARIAFQVPCPGGCYVGGGALAISPSGRTAYLTFSAYGVLVLARDPATGALSGPPAGGCWSFARHFGCAIARGLLAPSDLLVPPDARNVYAVSPDFAVSAFARAVD